MNKEYLDSVYAYIDANRDNIVEDLIKVARIESVSREDSDVKPFGQSCRNVLDYMLKKGEEDYQYVILSASADLKECSKLLNERFAGKGGGSKQMIQGSLHGSDTEIKVFLHELFC